MLCLLSVRYRRDVGSSETQVSLAGVSAKSVEPTCHPEAVIVIRLGE